MGNVDYERGLAQLRSHAAGTAWNGEFLALELRLLENLGSERQYGSSETLRHDRAQIVNGLNLLALRHVGIDFNSLCRSAPVNPVPRVAAVLDETPAAPPVVVVATAGVLRLTFTNDSTGLSLGAENIGEQELTEISITLRPPAHVFLSDQSIRAARLPAKAHMNQRSLTLFFDTSFIMPFNVSYRIRHGATERFEDQVHII